MHCALSTFSFPAMALAALASAAAAQCSLQPSMGLPQPQLTGHAMCTAVWDPDGAGPAPQVLVVGGSDLVADDVFDATLLTWDGSAWHTLGGPGPLDSYVTALLVWNGQLVAAGVNAFGPQPVQTWNGTSWQPIGTPFTDAVGKLVVWNGTLVAVTKPTFLNQFVIHQWNGTTWTSLPTPPTVGIVHSIVSYQGLLCVGGQGPGFNQGVLERWNGTSWLPSIVTNVGTNNEIRHLAARTSLMVGVADTLYAAGSFATIGGTTAANIAATPGGSAFAWSALGAGLALPCTALAVRNTGLTSEVVAGTLQSLFSSAPVFRYATSPLGGTPTWNAMGDAYLSTIRFFSGQYFATRAAWGNASLVRYNGTAWSDVASAGLDGQVNAVTPFADDMIVGGTFTTDGAASLGHVARWNGAALQPLGTGIVGTSVDVLLTLANGEVVAGGLFTNAGGSAAVNIARWNGSTWSPLGSGLDNQVLALAQAPNGDLLAGGRFSFAGSVPCARVARWDGSAWSPLGFGMNGDVHALVARDNGTVIAGGAFTLAGGVVASRVAQWDGSTWSSLGTGISNGTVFGLTKRPNGEVVAVGSFTMAGGVTVNRCARWSGIWSSMGISGWSDNTPPRRVLTLPNGDVLAGRGFHQPGAEHDAGISRWNGTSWSGVGVTLETPDYSASVDVRAMALRSNGDVVLGGYFNTVGNVVSLQLARLSSTCAASATPYGAGCSSAAGPLVITADTLPWIGSTFRTTTTGIAPVSLCLGLTGFSQQSIPLSAVLPQGQLGCSLSNSFELVDLLPSGPNGTATSALALANSASLIGAQFYQQTVPLEFDAQFALTAVRSSNALALVIGKL